MVRFVQRLFHRRIAVAEPVLHQVNSQHRHQRIGWTPALALGVMRVDQGNQSLPRHNLIHFDQDKFLAGLLAYSASAKVICFIGKLGGWNPGIFPKSGSLLQSSPNGFANDPVLSSRCL